MAGDTHSKRAKGKIPYQNYESVGGHFIDFNGTKRQDTSARICESMLQSPAYKHLKTRQKQLYLLCKAQEYGKHKPQRDFREEGLFQTNDYFYLNLGNVVKYGLYTKNMKKEFYGDMVALEEHGFIKLAAKGGGDGQTKSIYQYSAAWKDWKP